MKCSSSCSSLPVSVSILLRKIRALSVLLAASVYLLCQGSRIANGADTRWMLKAQYGLFMHYQYGKAIPDADGTWQPPDPDDMVDWVLVVERPGARRSPP
ncbi:MAG TPA: hypothetical protein VMW38_03635 [Terriglobia bacterium]|nr:hypothetical protein [Terriglobia bacterium]